MLKKILLISTVFMCLCLPALPLSAQETLDGKIRSKINEAAINEITIDDFAWMAGHWQGEAFGGVAEDIWAPPRGGAMIGLFRSTNDKGVSFYEIITLGEQDGVFMMRLKHFTPELHGWETKDETIDFVLLDYEVNSWFFEGLTIERHDADSMTIFLQIGSSEGTRVVPFRYMRVSN